MQASIRSFALLGLVFSVADSPDVFAQDDASQPPPDPVDRPVSNVSGGEIRLLKQHRAAVGMER